MCRCRCIEATIPSDSSHKYYTFKYCCVKNDSFTRAPGMPPLIERSPWFSSVRCHQPEPNSSFPVPQGGWQSHQSSAGWQQRCHLHRGLSQRSHQTSQEHLRSVCSISLRAIGLFAEELMESNIHICQHPEQDNPFSIPEHLAETGGPQVKGMERKVRGHNPNQANNFAEVANLKESENHVTQVRHCSGEEGGETHLKSILLDGRERSGAGGTSPGAHGRQLWNSPIQRGQTSVTINTAEDTK